MIPFGPFLPSRSQYAADASTVAINVLPVADGWAPMPGLFVSSAALPAACKGAVFVRTGSGSVYVFAGTETGLYKFNSATSEWSDVTRAVGGPYAVPENDRWSFSVFGDYLVATNISDDPQRFEIEAGTNFEAIPGSPPRAKFCWLAGDFLTLGNLEGYPRRLQWSGLNDMAHWTVGEKGADYQDFPDGGAIQAGLTEVGGAVIFQQSAIRFQQMDLASGYVFRFPVLNPSNGAVAARSVVSYGPGQYAFLSEDGFFIGADRKPIGAEAVDEWFLEDELEANDITLVQGVADPKEKIIWWHYRNKLNQGRIIGYDWNLGRWCFSDLDVTYLASLQTPGVTWDQLGDLYTTIDDVKLSYDSRRFKGGQLAFAAFNTDNKMCLMTGPNLAATVETASVEHNPGQRSFTTGVRVLTDAVTHTVAVGKAGKHGEAIVFDAATSPAPTGLCPARANGRLLRYRATIPAAVDWKHLHGVVPDVRPAGRR